MARTMRVQGKELHPALDRPLAEEYPITFREEARNQYSRIDISDYLRTFVRFLKVLVNPPYRTIYREALASYYN